MNSEFPYKPTAQLLGSKGPINAITYTGVPGYVLTGSSDRQIRLYNPSSTQTSSSSTTTTTTTTTTISHLSSSLSLSSSSSSSSSLPASSYITTPHSASQAQAQAQALSTVPTIVTYTGAHNHPILALSVSRAASHFASAGADRAIMVWDVARYDAPARRIAQVPDFSASASAGGGAGLGFGADAATTVRGGGHRGRINALAFAADSGSSSSSGGGGEGGGSGDGMGPQILASGGLDATVRLWDLRQRTTGGGAGSIMVLAEGRDAIQVVVVRGAEIVSGSLDGRVRSYDVRMGRVVTDVVSGGELGSTSGSGSSGALGSAATAAAGRGGGGGGLGGITSIDIDRAGKSMLVGCLDGSLTAPVPSSTAPQGSPPSASASAVSPIMLFDRDDGTCLRKYYTTGASAKMPAASPASHTPPTPSWPRTRKNAELKLQSVFGGDGRWVLSGDETDWGSTTTTTTTASVSHARPPADAKLWVWDVLSGRVVTILHVPAGPLSTTDSAAVEAGKGRRRLVVGSDGREKERANALTCIAWNHDGLANSFVVAGTSGVATVYGKCD